MVMLIGLYINGSLVNNDGVLNNSNSFLQINSGNLPITLAPIIINLQAKNFPAQQIIRLVAHGMVQH
ncbi:MAG: hypothetical protein R2807_04820 [Chitinophagales bacterium]